MQLFKNSSMKELPLSAPYQFTFNSQKRDETYIINQLQDWPSTKHPPKRMQTHKNKHGPLNMKLPISQKSLFSVSGLHTVSLNRHRGEVWKFTSLLQHQGQWVAGWVSPPLFSSSCLSSCEWYGHHIREKTTNGGKCSERTARLNKSVCSNRYGAVYKLHRYL